MSEQTTRLSCSLQWFVKFLFKSCILLSANKQKIDETKVLFCGNIEERKNIIRLAKAVNCLGYKLTLAGRVRDKKILDEMTINNYNYTHIDGYQNESIEHLQLMNEHDIFAFQVIMRRRDWLR